jgi:hypothetical protein
MSSPVAVGVLAVVGLLGSLDPFISVSLLWPIKMWKGA